MRGLLLEVVATPIRWGGASSLYYKMVERMNCIQNQETIANRHLLRNKVAGFIITGGQDNVQASSMLHDGAAALVGRCEDMAKVMIESTLGEGALKPGGRKGHSLDVPGQGERL